VLQVSCLLALYSIQEGQNVYRLLSLLVKKKNRFSLRTTVQSFDQVMGKCKSGKRARRDAAAKSAPDIKDADVDQKMKINQFSTRMEKRREKGSLRIQMFNRMKEEEELRKGMSIRDAFLQEQGIDVKEDEVKCEKYEFDAYKHAKKVQNGELIYPSRPASVGGGSVSSHHPVRTMMRKFTQKRSPK